MADKQIIMFKGKAKDFNRFADFLEYDIGWKGKTMHDIIKIMEKGKS